MRTGLPARTVDRMRAADADPVEKIAGAAVIGVVGIAVAVIEVDAKGAVDLGAA